MINNSVASQFIVRLEAIEQSNLLLVLKGHTQQEPNNNTNATSLDALVSEFFRLFNPKYVVANFQYSLSSDFFKESPEIKVARRLLFDFLATQPDLCAEINKQYDAKNPSLYPTGLQESAIDEAVKRQNIAFLLFALKIVDDNVISAKFSNKYKPLRDSIVNIAKSGLNIKPINDYLEAMRTKHGESSIRWKTIDGPLFNDLNEVQRKQMQNSSHDAVLFSVTKPTNTENLDQHTASNPKMKR